MTRLEFLNMIGVKSVSIGFYDHPFCVGVEGVISRDTTYIDNPYYEGMYCGYMMALTKNNLDLQGYKNV